MAGSESALKGISPIRGGKAMKRKTWLISPSMFIIFAFAIVPLFIMLYFSFISDSGQLSLDHYIHFFSNDLYLNLTWETIKLSVMVTIICIILGFPLAYILAKHIHSGKNILLALIVIPLWTSQLVRAYSWLTLLSDGGVFESLLKKLHIISVHETLGILFTETAVIIALVHIYLPFMVITIFMTLEKLEDSVLEASYSLGAKPIITFGRVILPLARPGIISGSILVFVPCLGVFVEPRILGGPNGSVIGTVIEDQFFEIYGWNFGAAIAFILLTIVVTSMMILSKFSNEGSVKDD